MCGVGSTVSPRTVKSSSPGVPRNRRSCYKNPRAVASQSGPESPWPTGAPFSLSPARAPLTTTTSAAALSPPSTPPSPWTCCATTQSKSGVSRHRRREMCSAALWCVARRGAALRDRRGKTDGRRLATTRASGEACGACTTDPDPTMLQTTHSREK